MLIVKEKNMQLFLHTQTKIRIISGDLEWNGTPAEFALFEPDYPGLPILTVTPAAVRYQSPELRYIEDTNGTRHPDLIVDALPYCDKIAIYNVTPPAIYVAATLSKTLLCSSDPNDAIALTAALRAGPEPDAPVLPISATWPIMLRQKNGLAMDNILITFANGTFAGEYTYTSGLPLGEWCLDEQDFDPVTFGGQTYQVRLSNPIRFTIYRNL
jgi:hypothetical protein